MLQAKVIARNKEDIGTRVAFQGQKFTITAPDGVLHPQPMPAIAEAMLKNPMFCLQGLETSKRNDTYSKTDSSVVAPTPDAVRARVLAQTRATNNGPVFGDNKDLVRTMQRYQREPEDVQPEAEPVPAKFDGLPGGHAPSPAMLREKIAAAAKMREEFALKDAPVVDEEKHVELEEALVGFQLDDDVQEQADALAALADLSELAEASEQPSTTDYAEMTLTQLRAIAKDRKVPGWADMSQAKLVRALRNRE